MDINITATYTASAAGPSQLTLVLTPEEGKQENLLLSVTVEIMDKGVKVRFFNKKINHTQVTSSDATPCLWSQLATWICENAATANLGMKLENTFQLVKPDKPEYAQLFQKVA
jgi:hypothetical protein